MVAKCNPTVLKAIEIANGGGVQSVGNGRYFVQSSTAGAFYQVQHTAHKWTCTCEHFKTSGRLCKHILAAFKVEDKANMQARA